LEDAQYLGDEVTTNGIEPTYSKKEECEKLSGKKYQR